MPSVTVFFSGQEQATYPLDKPTIIVGREEACQIHIDNRSISRQHCAFYAKGDGFIIQDLNSANGTYVNGHKITEHALVPGDMVIIGKYELRFNDSNGAHGHHHSSKKADAHPPRKKNLDVEEPTESFQLWFYAVDGEQKGPVEVATLRKLVRDKTISPESLVWHAGMKDWIPAKEAPGVAGPEEPPSLQAEAAPVPKPAEVEKPRAAPEVEKPRPVEKAHAPAAEPAAKHLASEKFAFSEAERKTCSSLAKFLQLWGWILVLLGGYGAEETIRHAAIGPGAVFPVALILFAIVTLTAGKAFARIEQAQGDDRENLFYALGQLSRLYTTKVIVVPILVAVAVAIYFLMTRT